MINKGQENFAGEQKHDSKYWKKEKLYHVLYYVYI